MEKYTLSREEVVMCKDLIEVILHMEVEEAVKILKKTDHYLSGLNLYGLYMGLKLKLIEIK